MKYLFLAEKNSVMKAVKDAYENNRAVIEKKLGGEIIFAALSGHVCRWLEPSEYEEWKDLKWRQLELPLTPQPFQISGIKDGHTASILKTVRDMIRSEKPDAYIVGTDSDVEGNGIFFLLSRYLGIGNKPTLRFFEQSLTEKEVVSSLLNMTDFYKEPRDVRMTDTYITRSQFDWLVGMNATIAITLRSGELYRVGRVKAPTLKLVYDNSLAIENFKPHSDFQIKAEFSGGFTGMMLDEDGSGEACFDTKEKAEAFIAGIEDPQHALVKHVERKTNATAPPSLYKLSTLQSDAGSKFNYSPKVTLDTVQELYEKKMLTYPRTDGIYVSSAKAETFDALIEAVGKVNGLQQYTSVISPQAIERVKHNKKVVNDAEVKKSSHDALLPTEVAPDLEKLTPAQRNIYLLVARRFISQFYSDKEDIVTTMISDIGGYEFKSKGQVNIVPGWSVLYSSKSSSEKIPDTIKTGDTVDVKQVTTHEKISKPPKRLTSASLVTAMENIAKYIDDKRLKGVMKEAKGIGTQATRADIIEQLIVSKYIQCEGTRNELTITDMGKRYMAVMQKFSITDPSSAAEWESMFQSVKEGLISRETAHEKTMDYVYDFIDEVAKADIKAVSHGVSTIEGVQCPYCGGEIKKLSWGYSCINSKEGGCNFKLSAFNGKVSEKDVKELIEKGQTHKITAIAKSKKTGKPFNAKLKLMPKGSAEAVQFLFEAPSELSVKCPYCGGNIMSYEWGYGCENWKEGCRFMVGSQKGKVTAKDVETLVTQGETGLIKNLYKEKKTNKWVSAKIVLNPEDDGSGYATHYAWA